MKRRRATRSPGATTIPVLSRAPGRDRRSVRPFAAAAAALVLASAVLTPSVANASGSASSGDKASWQVTDFPVRYGGLSAIATSGDAVVTVGFGIATPFIFTALAATWDGTDWHRQPVRLPDLAPDTYVQLVDVDLTSATSGWAVGRGFNTSGSVGIAARWNGDVWKGVSTAGLAGSVGLLGVTAVSSNDIWAVGQRQVERKLNPVIGHYDGATWTEVDVPPLEHVAPQTPLLSIAEDAEGTLWAVGQGGLSLRYDGASWRQVAVPKVAGKYVSFQKVRSLGSAGVWAVGYVTEPDGRHPVAMHWDGTAWQPAQIPVGDLAELNDVSRTTGGVVAIGYDSTPAFYGLKLDPSGQSKPLALPPGEDALFGSATNDAGSQLWVVGSGPIDGQSKLPPYVAVRG